MFWKWEKIPTILQFSIQKISLKKEISGEFQLSWVRGDSSGSTNKIVPNSKGDLIFNKEFICPCTMYINKSDKSARQKNIKMVLKRFSDSSTSKVYGKLSLDFSNYFLIKDPSFVCIEMESGRSVPPTLNVVFQFAQSSSSFSNFLIDEGDMSFIGDAQEKKISVDEWDTTESLSSSRKELLMPNDHVGDATFSLSSFSSKNRHIERKKKKKSHEKEKAKIKDTIPEAPIVPIKEPLKVVQPKVPCFEDKISLMIEIITRPWPPYKKDIFIDSANKIKLPPSVYPIFKTLDEIKLFVPQHSDDSSFDMIMQRFINEIPNVPLNDRCSTENRFLTYVMLFVFVTNNIQSGFDKFRVDKFVELMSPLIINTMKAYLNPILISFEAIINRFITAKFNMQHLIYDFAQVFQCSKDSFHFPIGIQRLVFSALIQLVDFRCMKKLFSNPQRFCFSNSAQWSSFLSAFESDKSIILPKTRQTVFVIMMAHNIALDPTLKNEICPSLDNSFILYILKNFQYDDSVSIPIPYDNFSKFFGVYNDRIPEEDATPIPLIYESIIEGISLNSFKNIVIDDIISELYPYMK